MRIRPRAGFTFIELVIVLALAAILVSAATPKMRRYVDQIRVRSALDRLVGEIYRTRILAVERGTTVRLILETDPGRCVRRARIDLGDPSRPQPATIVLPETSACIRHNADSVLIFNSRGMLRPPARSIFADGAFTADSVVLSIAGRVRRSY